AGRPDIHDVAFLELVAEIAGNQAAGPFPSPIRWERGEGRGPGRPDQLLDRNPVLIGTRPVGKRVATDELLRLAGNVQPEGQKLARLETGDGLPVVGLEMERADAASFTNL